MAKKGTPEYEEWLRHYREKRGKKVDEPSETRTRKQDATKEAVQQTLFPEVEKQQQKPASEMIPKGTKKLVYSKSQNKDLEVEVIRFVPSSNKYLCKRADGKFLYYGDDQFKDIPAEVKQPSKKDETYTNSKKDSVSIVPEGTMSAKIEKTVEPIVWDMSKQGMKIDKSVLAEAKIEAENTLEEHKKQLEELVGHPVNFNNPREVSKLLFDELKLEPKKIVSRDGKVLEIKSTSADDLEELAKRTGSPVPALISTLRSDSRLISAYINKFEKIANRGDGALRNLFQPSTVSGRFATAYNPTLVEVPDNIETQDKIYFPPDLEEIGMGSVCPL